MVFPTGHSSSWVGFRSLQAVPAGLCGWGVDDLGLTTGLPESNRWGKKLCMWCLWLRHRPGDQERTASPSFPSECETKERDRAQASALPPRPPPPSPMLLALPERTKPCVCPIPFCKGLHFPVLPVPRQEAPSLLRQASPPGPQEVSCASSHPEAHGIYHSAVRIVGALVMFLEEVAECMPEQF